MPVSESFMVMIEEYYSSVNLSTPPILESKHLFSVSESNLIGIVAAGF
jgi:hypothetical protein